VLLVHNLFIPKLEVLKIHMNNQRKALSTVAIAAVVLVFAATPIIIAYVQSHDAQAFGRGGFGRGFGFRGGFGRFGGFGFGGFGGGFGGWGGGGCCGCCGCGGGGWGGGGW
jgi:hypothetical protein